jgi:hypothetical protein
MSITYHPATLSDAQSFARCQVEAFMEDKVHQTATGLTPDASLGVLEENLDYRTARYERRIANQHFHWIKAVDASTGALAGFSGWEEPENQKPDEVDSEKTLEWPSSWNMEFAKNVEEQMAEMKKIVLGERKDVWCTLPCEYSAMSIFLTGLPRCRNASSVAFLPRPRHRPGAHKTRHRTSGPSRRRYVPRIITHSKKVIRAQWIRSSGGV